MTDGVKDTSKDYDHMIGYIADENINKSSLDTFLGEEQKEYKPEVRKKEKDSEFPEEWQKLWVNFGSFEDYAEFMTKLSSKPVPKLKSLIYEKPGAETGLSSFFGDE